MKEIALIGPTASGKSDLALQLAQENNAYILSLDSLSLYKEIDIASAKPSKEELSQVKHFGVDLIYPNEDFSVSTFAKLYQDVHAHCQNKNKNLIIVGGSSFYLKTLLEGLSPIPEYTQQTKERVNEQLRDLAKAYQRLADADPVYMQNIQPTDAYRIEKMLLLYEQTQQAPSQYFAENPAKPIISALPIYEIDVNREYLRERIGLRTQKMLELGLISEVAGLEYRYGRSPNALKAIGIIEVFEYLDGRMTKEEMKEQIITHTAQLAKRQQTFNRTQFEDKTFAPVADLYTRANQYLQEVY
jgi:tRNA dimethylallyltransferase